MSKNRVAIAVTAATMVGLFFALYGVMRAPERAIVRCYGNLDAALNRKDIAGYMALLAPDYTEIRLSEKPKSRVEAEANYKQIMNDWSNFGFEPVEIEAISSDGAKVNITVKRTIRGDLLDRNGAFGNKGKSHRMVTITVSLDEWRYARQSWLLKRHDISLVQVYVDGKLLPGGTVHDDD